MAPQSPEEQTTHNGAEQRQACVFDRGPHLPDLLLWPFFHCEEQSESEHERDGDLPAEGDAKQHREGNERENDHEMDQHNQWAHSPHLVSGSVTSLPGLIPPSPGRPTQSDARGGTAHHPCHARRCARPSAGRSARRVVCGPMNGCTALAIVGLALLIPAIVVIALVRYDRPSRWFVYLAGILGLVIVAIGAGRCW